MHDLGPAARELSRLAQGVRDDQLAAPTPCPDYTLGDLLDHVHGLAIAFAMAARKTRFPGEAPAPSGDASRLPEDWRSAIEARLEDLVAAWREEGAWAGATTIAGFDAPAEQIGITAVNELVVHGWDLALASDQTLEVHEESLGPCAAMAAVLTGPQGEQMRQGGFGPPVAVGDDAPPIDRIVAANGREPGWRAAHRATR